MDCIWVKLNELNKCRDAASAEGFAGYSLFQNLIAGGQNKDGEDVTNDLSFMCIQPSVLPAFCGSTQPMMLYSLASSRVSPLFRSAGMITSSL